MNMEVANLNNNGESCPELLNLISKERDWLCKRNGIKSSDDTKLELRLGPPGQETNYHHHHYHHQKSLASLGDGCGGGGWFKEKQGKESSQHCSTKVAVVEAAPVNTAVSKTSQKRTASGPVVGWPPIRSFRKNLAAGSCSSKPALDSHDGNVSSDLSNKKIDTQKLAVETTKKGFFVKINMDGVPIGRKVDLGAYNSYEKLSVAVDELFRGLLAAQRDSCAGGIMIKQEETKAITGVLDGSGEYTLVYEDNEGDRMLVGDDVPWQMFVSTVRRLRVLKSSEVSALSRKCEPLSH